MNISGTRSGNPVGGGSAETGMKEIIELYSKLGAFVVICLYLAGFLTVNKYLDQHGVSDFSLIQARFISAGALTLIFLLLDFLCISIGLWLIRNITKLPYYSDQKSGMRKRDFEWYARIFLIVSGYICGGIFIIFPWIIFAYFVNPIRCTPPISFLHFIQFQILDGSIFSLISYFGEAHALYFLGTAISFIAVWIIRVTSDAFMLKNQKERQPWWLARNNTVPFILSLMVVVYLFNIYLGLFVKDIYPQVPEQFGGEPPKLVSLLFGDSAKKGATQLGISMDTENLSKPLTLLFEASDGYIISGKSPEAKAIRLNKSMIQAIEIIDLGHGCGW